jgi:hypothetical protein
VADPAPIDGATVSPGLAEAVLRDALAAFPYVRLRVTGGCMAPALLEGDLVHVAGVGARAPRLRDVVLVWSPSGPLLHRLVWAPLRAPRWWRTKADRAALLDPRPAPGALLGTVVAVERAGATAPVPRGALLTLTSLSRAIAFRARAAVARRRR